MKKIISIASFSFVLAAAAVTVEAQSPKQTAQDRDARQAERQAQREAVQSERQAERAGNQEERVTQRGVQTCSRIVEAVERMQKNIGAAQVRGEEQTDMHVQRIADHKEKKILTRTRNQERMDERRVASYDRLSGRAQTPEGQSAVTAYKSAIEAAVTEHRGVVKEAFDAYWDGMETLVSEHKTQKKDSVSAFEAKIGELAQRVQAQCASDDVEISPQDIRSEAKSLRDRYREDRISKGTLQVEISAARSTYQSIIVDAKQSYRAAVNAARADLQAVIGGADDSYGDSETEEIEVTVESDQDNA